MPFQSPQNEPVAIVGSSCRFPGPASSISKLWQLLQNPCDISREVPSERFNTDAFYHPDPKHHGTFNTRRAYFLEEDPRVFDASFFQINSREAETMDPQQRILLETVYEALEAGGHRIEKLQGSQTAVFVGGMSCDFRDTVAVRDPTSIPEYSATGTHNSILAARISYFYDWKGPSMSIDTACSSSLVAVHQAVQALRNGEATAAVAAGSNLNLGPEQFVALSNLRMLSPKGRVRMWDREADGYARGEGFGAVILKTLSQAEVDGDQIECILRGSGVNQDGHTMGLTMPNAESQTALITQVYDRAGLTISDPLDQPQYFEAHGTGTPAGDPIEAEAIYRAFLSSGPSGGHEPLYVGSIKTVTGHLEGAAGIAGLLKASLAVQHGIIPPNLHFENLNPKIEQYYDGMQVPTGSSRPWPALPDGRPRRASVNSFGFGGTNAHVILESYMPVKPSKPSPEPMQLLPPVTPLTISAKSECALARRIEALVDYIERSADRVDLGDLAYTLESRTSRFPLKKAFSGVSREAVLSSMRESLHKPDNLNGRRSETAKPRILGIFTGQGAQSARMGAALVEKSAGARKTLRGLEIVLASIHEPPSWSLTDELLRNASSSRIRDAELSQPLCTALQIIIVDHLRAAGVKFDCVVGHSSGEIAAAYAAGLVSARDAICIAYYRGLYSKLAAGPCGEKGSMIATGMSFEDAAAFCEQSQFSGRLGVAASNSPSSSTLSGDDMAVEEAKCALNDTGVFSRKLFVDIAYHSHHMQSVGDVYARALQNLGIATRTVSKGSMFVSSVSRKSSIECAMGPGYWKDNMVRPVLFSQAVQQAVSSHGPFDIALEIGPHPALKGPAIETLKAVGCELSYHGTLQRDMNSVQAMSEVLGFLYENTRMPSLDFESYRKLFFAEHYQPPKLVTGLPSYPWDHDRILYRESRTSHRYLHNPTPRHGLLGQLLPDDSSRELRWRNVVSLETVPWIKDHTIQGQAVVAAMWYLVMALEAATFAANQAPVEIMEVKNFRIDKALPMDQGIVVETLFSLTMSKAESRIQATFSCSAGPLYGAGRLEPVFSGEITVDLCNSIYENQEDELTRNDTPPGWIPLSTCNFYDYLKVIGYGYERRFRGLETLSKRGTKAKSTAFNPSSQWLVHPATLDLALQTLLAAHFNQDDDNMSLIVPQAFDRFLLYPRRCAATTWSFEAVVGQSSHEGVLGDIHISDAHGRAIALMENVSWRPLTLATPSSDRKMFYTTVFEPDISHGSPISVVPYSQHELQLVSACDRIALYYYRSWRNLLSAEDWATAEPHHRRLLAYIEHLSEEVAEERIPTLQRESAHESWTEIQALFDSHPDSVDLTLLRTVGEKLPTSIREKRPMLEFMLQHDQLADYYTRGLGYEKCYGILKTMVRRVVHRYPHMDVLEVGAGTGGATKHILDAMGDKFHSYTFTDVSSGFFERAKERFEAATWSRMLFKTFDLERDPLAQGFEAGSFDLVIGSLVVHATRSIQHTLQRLRLLLKPGGYLILVEGSEETLRSGFMMSGLPGWWVGGDDRPWGPMLGLGRWSELLKAAGFSGIDVASRDSELSYTNLGYVFVSQAVNQTINFLRDPLNVDTLLGDTRLEHVAVVGRYCIQEVLNLLNPHVKHVSALEGLEDVSTSTLPRGTPVILLSDLDNEAFQKPSAENLRGLQELFELSSNLVIPLWLKEEECACSQALLGLVRSVRLEVPHLRIQTLGIKSPGSYLGAVVEALLRIASWPDDVDNALLWSFEPELDLVGDQILIPRVVEDTELTQRLNSKRRMIMQDLDPLEACIELVQHDGRLGPRCLRQFDGMAVVKENSIATLFSVTQPFYFGKKPYYLCVGKSQVDGTSTVALTETNCSIIKAITSRHTGPSNNGVMSRWLVLVAYSLYAQQRTLRFGTKARFVLHDADDALREAFMDVCQRYGQLSPFSSSSRSKPGLIYIPAHASRRQVQELHLQKSPEEVVHWIDCANRGASALIKASLPDTVCSKLFEDLPINGVGDDNLSKSPGIESALKLATGFANAQLETMDDLTISSDVCSASDLNSVETIHTGCRVQLIDWTAARNVTVPVRSVTETFNLFHDHKTYLLVGLTGDMGRTLTDWMVAQGARYIALASRRPQIDRNWIADLEKQGSIIKIYSMDVCRRYDVQATREAIAADGLPPVGGVVNGAMVLRDSSFYDMTNDQMTECLRPKMEGSRNLSTVFEDLALDFFVLFSSLAYTLGNPGQSNYAAANGFMEGFARERRAKGQAASVISLGVVGRVGYLARTRDGNESEHARKRNVLTIMPEELCDIFAEAVVAGRRISRHAVEVIAGLDGRIDSRLTAKESLASWMSDPRMSHIIVDKAQEAPQGGVSVAKADIVPLKVQLASVVDESAAVVVLTQHFLSKLERMSLVSKSGITAGSIPLTELGVDSLLAIEIRSWFMTELGVDMPVLKVLGGSTISAIVQHAVEAFQSISSSNSTTEDKRQVSSSESGIDTPSTNEEAQVGQLRRAVATFSQARMYRLHQFSTGAANVNNMSWSYSILGDLDVARFELALQIVLRPLEALRTRFTISDEQIMQEVMPYSAIRLDDVVISDEAELKPLFCSLADTVHDPYSGHLIRAILVKVSITKHVLMMSFHHIGIDTRSCEILLADLHRAYSSPDSFVSSHDKASTHPIDLAELETPDCASGSWTTSIDFWNNHLAGANLLLPLFPCAKVQARRAMTDFHLSSHHEYLSAHQMGGITSLCKAWKCSAYHIHTAVFAILLHQLTGRKDVIIGSVDAGRDIPGHPSFAEAFGPMFNYLPLHLHDIPRPSNTDQGHLDTIDVQQFKTLVRHVRDTTYAVRAHAHVPFDMIVDILGEERMPATHHPVYQAQINYIKHTLEEIPLGPELKMRLRDAQGVEVSYDFCVSILEGSEGARIAFQTQEYLYGPEQVMMLGAMYMRMLKSVMFHGAHIRDTQVLNETRHLDTY